MERGTTIALVLVIPCADGGALAFDNLAHSWRPTADPGFLGLFEKGLYGGEGLIRNVEFAGPHRGGLQEKV
jgi:hypothetical protein